MSWRDVLPIHPAAELFPLMTPAELRELGEDIKANGLKLPIAITSDGQLLDGRNRLDAMEAVGVEFKFGRTTNGGPIHIDIGTDDLSFPEIVKTDPYAYVISANLHRRHLTAEQKRELIAEQIKAQPEKPDLQIAKTVKASPTTVGTVRRGMEAKGDVSKLETRRDIKGRQQPAKKPRKAGRAKVTEPPPQVADEVLQQRAAAAERIRALLGKPPKPDDVGPDSPGEAARLRVRVDELQAEKRRLQIKILGLESEIEELRGKLKAGGDMSISEFQVAIKKWEETVETQRGIIARLENENAKLRAGGAAPPLDDGLDIPECLRRAAP